MSMGRLGNVESLARAKDKCNSNSVTKRWKREPRTMKPHQGHIGWGFVQPNLVKGVPASRQGG